MSVVADLLVKISGDSSDLRKELNATKRQINSAFGQEAMKASQASLTHLKYLTAGFVGAGFAAVKFAADMEQTEIAFETLLGSAEAAQKMVKDLTDFAARTPFQMPGITKSAQQLLAYGFQAESIIPMLTSVGNAISGLGGNEENMQSVIRALGQIQAKGKVSAEEIQQMAEQGINAWKYLADAAGVSISEVQSLASKGALSSRAAIETIVNGMNQQFKGGMEKQSQSMNGLMSTVMDNVVGAARVIGNDLSDAFDFKDILKDTGAFLSEFTRMAESSGVGEAMRTLIPDSLKVGVIALASAYMARLVPALYTAWINMKLVIGAMTLMQVKMGVLTFGISFLITEMLGYTNVTRTAISKANELTNAFLEQREAMKNLKPGEIGKNITDNKKASDWIPKTKTEVAKETGDDVLQKEIASMKERNSLQEAYNTKKQLTESLVQKGTDAKAAKAAAAALKKQQREYDSLCEKAKDTSDRIEDEWIQMTGTKMDVLEKWYSDEITTLNETKAANGNYQRDMVRLEETYSEKRRQIIHDEALEKQRTFEEISNGYTSMWTKLSSGGLKGSAADIFGMEQKAADDYKNTTDYFSKINAEYASGTEAQKANIINSLKAMGIQYKVTTEESLDFALEKEAAAAEIWKQLQNNKLEYYQQCRDIQAGIEEAYRQNSITMLQESLSEENAVMVSYYEAQKELMDLWQEATLAAHATTAELMANIYTAGFNGISNAISDILTGTASIEDAFKSLGKSILKVIADYYAKKIAGILLESAIGESALAVQTALSIKAGAKVAKAWSAAAANVSLATFGANAIPAGIGISAVHALTAALSGASSGSGGTDDWHDAGNSIPKMANGGIPTGPTLAMIGEGRTREAVLPLSDKVFRSIAEGINGAGERSSATVNIYGDINSASDEDRIFSRLFDDTRFALMGA